MNNSDIEKCLALFEEEIYGNIATVYHRCDKNKLERLLSRTYRNHSTIDFDEYDKALYTTYDMKSQLNLVNNKNDMKKTYGDYIIKLGFKGVNNCWFCDFKEYKKYNKCTIENWKDQQIKKFGVENIKYMISGFTPEKTADHATVSNLFERYHFLGRKVKGIQYIGDHDGDCLLIYDWTTAVPLSISKDEGKTWEKITDKRVNFQKSNFDNNNVTETRKRHGRYELDLSEKNIKRINFRMPKGLSELKINNNQITSLEGCPKVLEELDCSYNRLTNLIGCAKKVNILNCSHNQITSLEGCPIRLDKIYMSSNNITSLKELRNVVETIINVDCSDNQLTTLKGCPRNIFNFNCSGNNLISIKDGPKDAREFVCYRNKNLPISDMLKYLKGAIYIKRFSCDYGDFKSREEAIAGLKKALMTSNKSIKTKKIFDY